MLKKTILLGLTAVLMTACGSNESGGASSSGGSGGCVDMSIEDAVGLTNRVKGTAYHNGKAFLEGITSRKLESFTKTSSKEIFYDDNENMTGTTEFEYSISNGLIKVTKAKVHNISNNMEITYDPYYILATKIGENCEGDTWESEYVSYSKVDGRVIPGPKTHEKYTIEDVNVEKTVTAGTFNTIKIHRNSIRDKRLNSKNSTDIWVDIDTNMIILSENYYEGKLSHKVETLDIY